MSEGVVALWIAGEQEARRTEELVGKLGFPVARGMNMRFDPSGPLRGTRDACRRTSRSPTAPR